MSLALTATTLAISPGLSSSFLAIGGTAPYTYTVIKGGVGGSIATDGTYTAPQTGIGVDTIQVIDSTGDTAESQILVDNPLELFCEVIQHELGLQPGRVYLWDQKINMPKDQGLFVVVGVLSCKPFANTVDTDGSGAGLDAIQSTNFMATLSVDIISRGPEARDRKEEVIMALNSIYAQQQQEINSFYIAKISSSFQNLSQEDGAAIPYRFNLAVNVQYFMKKIKAVDYFDIFSTTTLITEP